MQEKFYKKGTSDYEEHNENKDYWELLLGNIEKNGKAIDFGCGKGRNVGNMISLNIFDRVDGADLSQANIDHCIEKYEGSKFYKNNGTDLSDIKCGIYSFVMSTITLVPSRSSVTNPGIAKHMCLTLFFY